MSAPLFPPGTQLYRESLEKLLHEGQLQKDHRILVLCAGDKDKQVFEGLGFENVTISNLSKNLRPDEFAPFGARAFDAEEIACDDGEYDYCVVHAGLHHCQSPQRAILEMYRVAKTGILFIEPNDSAFIRLACRLGFAQEFEVASTIGKTNFKGGGLRFGGIPNFVYRFTAREVEKCIETNAPYARHHYRVLLRMQVYWEAYRLHRSAFVRLGSRLARPIVSLLGTLPWFANNIAVAVLKPDLGRELHPWLTQLDGEIQLDDKWVETHYSAPSEEG
jgi:SAM-dependent methyltransferase